MTIYIAEIPEPSLARPSTTPVNLAESAASGRLKSELDRYVAGEISGRSFLISGHRGAGKTTLVLKAIEQAAARALNTARTMPLLVPLHGPDLLSDSKSTIATEGKNQEAAASNPSPDAATPQAVIPDGDTREFLRQLAIGIYRALADHFYRLYWQTAELKSSTNTPKYRDLPEMAAQLRVELDGSPDLALLREFWKKADALPSGISLQARAPNSTQPYLADASLRNRGMLELLALSSASQAYKLIRGELKTTEGTKEEDLSKTSVAIETISQVKNLLNPLLGALAGVAVGWGLKGSDFSSIASSLAGTATGLGVAVTLNYSSSRSRQKTRTAEKTFLPDTTIASLDRALPLLVDRCREAGLALVFVVDELDKVSNLDKRMGDLVKHLKSLVTERSFFCFLADRSYFESLRRTLATSPYRAEYTYFSDRLFILYRPGDLHKYLRENLLSSGNPTDSNDVIDLELLPYILLHRSRMHPFDLRRQLARMRNSDGAFSVPSGAVRTALAYRFDVLIQVAVEWLLDRPTLQERINQDEEFTQLIYDTLYYPSRMWEQGSTQLDVSRDAFLRYLGLRMSTASTPPIDPNDDGCPLSVLDQDFLFARLRELIAFLAEPARLKIAIAEENPTRFAANALAAIPIPDGRKFKLLESTGIDQYLWLHDLFGRSVDPPGVEVVLKDVEPKEEFIQKVQEALNTVGANVSFDRLAADFNVLSATPAWSSVNQSLRRLKRLRNEARFEAYSEMESDFSAVWEFSQMLQSSGLAVAEALISAKVLGQYEPIDLPRTSEQVILDGLWILSGQLFLRGLSIGETRDKLHRFMAEMKSAFPWLTFDETEFDFSRAPMNQWGPALNKVLSLPDIYPINRGTAEQFAVEVETRWRERFSQYFQDGTTVFEPGAGDLVCSAASIGLSRLLYLDLKAVSIASWTELVCRSFTDGSSFYPGNWTASPAFGVPALFQLGFGAQTRDFVNNWQIFQISSGVSSRLQRLQESRAEVVNWVQANSIRQLPSPKPGVVVVFDFSDPANLLGLDWIPSSKYAAVMVTKEQLFDLKQALQPIWTPTLISRVIVELASPAQWNSAPSGQLSAFPELLTVPYSYISRSAPPGLPSTGSPLVVSPKGLDEALELATPVVGHSPNQPSA